MDHYAIGAQDFWTVGPLDRNKFFRLAGPSSQSVQQHAVQHATPATRNFMDQVRKHLRHDLETHLDATRQGLRDRLRGPGVGGGYDKGPGAGGGYDKGPGVGGGYDRGPGAGGGYDD